MLTNVSPNCFTYFLSSELNNVNNATSVNIHHESKGADAHLPNLHSPSTKHSLHTAFSSNYHQLEVTSVSY